MLRPVLETGSGCNVAVIVTGFNSTSFNCAFEIIGNVRNRKAKVDFIMKGFG
jgi:hypothetical protein